MKYLTSEHLRSFLIFLTLAIFLYTVFKLLLRLIDYILFKKLFPFIIDTVFDEDNYENQNSDNYKNNFSTEDEWMKDKNKAKEQKRAEEKQFWQQRNNRPVKTRIVGIAKNAILGKWTALVVKRMANKMRFMDPRDIEEKGFYQAMILAERRMKNVEKSKFNSMNK